MVAGSGENERRSFYKLVFIMFLAGWILRLMVVAFLYRNQLDPAQDHFNFGWEVGRVARSLAVGEGFGSPFHGWTGPTAWLPPLYPYLLAAVFRVCGVYTSQSATAILALNSLFSALTCIPIVFITRGALGVDVAKGAGWIWVFYPYSVYFPAARVWEYALTTLLLALCFWATQSLHRRAGWGVWLGCGALWGATALANPSVLAVLPFLVTWAAYKAARHGRVWPARALCSVLGVILVTSPWMVRNYTGMHIVSPIRDNFWMEFWAGNAGDLSDIVPDWTHPSTSPVEMEKYRSEGEVAYLAQKRDLSLQFLREKRGLFTALTARRFAYYWTGYWTLESEYRKREPLALANLFFCTALTAMMLRGAVRWWRRDHDEIVPYLIMIAMYPVVYYITHPMIEYRQAIEPYVVVLVTAGWYSIRGKGETLRSRDRIAA